MCVMVLEPKVSADETANSAVATSNMLRRPNRSISDPAGGDATVNDRINAVVIIDFATADRSVVDVSPFMNWANCRISRMPENSAK